MAKRFCRVLVDLNCCYECTYCCNKIDGIMDKFVDIEREEYEDIIHKYDAVCLSGGEPLMPSNIWKTQHLAEKAKWYSKKVYVYTNLHYMPNRQLIHMVDGWSVGFHPSQTAIDDFVIRIQRMVAVGAKGVRVMVEKDKVETLNDLIGLVEIKTWEMNKCDKTDIEDWYKIVNT